MSNFREMHRNCSRIVVPKNFQPLKYEHITRHLKAHDLEIPLI